MFFVKSPQCQAVIIFKSIFKGQIHSDHTWLVRDPHVLVPQRKVWWVGEQQWNPPCGYGAGLRPLGYYAAENSTLLALSATPDSFTVSSNHWSIYLSLKNLLPVQTHRTTVSDKYIIFLICMYHLIWSNIRIHIYSLQIESKLVQISYQKWYFSLLKS